MPAASTSTPSGQVLGFDDTCRLTRCDRLLCDSCSSGQCFACGFLQIPPRDGHPCRPASGSRHQGPQRTFTSKSPFGHHNQMDGACAPRALPGARSRNPRPLDGVRVLWLCQKGSWQSIFRCCSRNDLNRKESHEPFSEINTCNLALSVSHCLGTKVSLSRTGRRVGPGGSSVYQDLQRAKSL